MIDTLFTIIVRTIAIIILASLFYWSIVMKDPGCAIVAIILILVHVDIRPKKRKYEAKKMV